MMIVSFGNATIHVYNENRIVYSDSWTITLNVKNSYILMYLNYCKV